jgi:UDP-N-acetylmuramoylalanine--D-glutamate ligase
MMKNDGIQRGMRVAVMGLGISGRAAVRYLLGCGGRVSVSDARTASQMRQEELDSLRASGVNVECGGHSAAFLNQADMIMVSPGIPFDLPVLIEARARGIAVVGELALAGPAITVPVIAITGTNGKTTVTSLIGGLLHCSGKKVFVGGNIGIPLFDYLCEPAPVDVVVLEVSSFQLETAGDFRPDVALLLNVTPDHLDRHGDLAGYAAAKKRIFANQHANDIAILGGDDSLCREMAAGLKDRKTLLFGHQNDCQAQVGRDRVVIDLDGVMEVYDLTGTALAGTTGSLNSAAAILAVRSMGCSSEDIRKGLAKFVPGPHRLAKVCEINGVAYYDDSKATNTGAVLSALRQFPGNVILIAGGRDKGDDYRLLRTVVGEKVKQLVVIGEAADKIAAALHGVVGIEHAGSMEDAVRMAAGAASPGDTVLLSPSCSSFDMFENYGQRGKAFVAAVEKVKIIQTEYEPPQ